MRLKFALEEEGINQQGLTTCEIFVVFLMLILNILNAISIGVTDYIFLDRIHDSEARRRTIPVKQTIFLVQMILWSTNAFFILQAIVRIFKLKRLNT